MELLVATLFSSLVGSLHCVGMCSPFAMLAMGNTPQGASSRERAIRLSLYHVGRLTTYLMMGVVLALLSSTIHSFVGDRMATRTIGLCVGVVMIAMGVSRLFASIFSQHASVSHATWLTQWTSRVIALRKSAARISPSFASYVWGVFSTWLPCGWLYLFVLAAAAAPTTSMIILTMIAFWIGTLPLLSVAAWSWGSIGPKWQVRLQPLAAICIIAFGTYTLTNRSEVDLSSLERPTVTKRQSLEMIRDAMNAKLPCCEGIGIAEPSVQTKPSQEQSPLVLLELRDELGSTHARNP